MSEVLRNNSRLHVGAYNEDSFTRDAYEFLALIIVLLGFFGLCNNLVVLIIYCRFKTLWTPSNLLLVNISFSNLLLTLFGVSFNFASCVNQQWIWDDVGCVFVGFCKNLLGSVSVFTTTVVAYERYIRVVHDKLVDFRWSCQAVIYVWLHSLAWTSAPLLGWNKYILELHGLDCSIDWMTKDPSESSFVLIFFLTNLAIPMGIMAYCYGLILYSIRLLGRLQQDQKTRILDYEVKVSLTCFLMMLTLFICFMPHPALSLLAMCGYGNMVTPKIAIVPSLLAIFNAATNPFIYIVMSQKFRHGLLKLFCLKCLRIQVMRKKRFGATVKRCNGGNNWKMRSASSSSSNSILTTDETDTQQSFEYTQNIIETNGTNAKIIYVQPL